MEWNEKLQGIIDYVEDHLQRKQEPIDPQEIARLAGCSLGFFQKVFSYMNGVSFSEYIRSRKMTLAGYELKSTDKKVVDVSYQYGYDSPTSFTKAFWQFHGITPKEARDGGVKLRVAPKLQVFVKQQYTWRLEEKEPFRLIGKSIRCVAGDEENQIKIPSFWSSCQKDGTFSTLFSMDAGTPGGLFGLFSISDENSSETEYSIMVISDQKTPPGWQEIHIPSVSWAIFDCRGPVPQSVQNGWNYLEEEWLVQYPFQHAACPELEWYSAGSFYAPDYLSQIWIPIITESR